MMNIVWIGCHEEGVEAFRAVLENGERISAFITLDDASFMKRSAGSRMYREHCRRYGVPYFTVDSIKSERAYGLIAQACPDIIIVLGWSEILPGRILDIPAVGTVGTHASLLPHNRGSAPVNWALINGEQTTGNTLMWLDQAVDAGDIIAQTEIPISIYDTCGTLYRRVAETNAEMLVRLLGDLKKGIRPLSPIRNATDEPVLPRRRPRDGLIRWDQSGIRLYNFIRALTHPYPGAFSFLDGEKWWLWEAALLPVSSRANGLRPGEIMGNVYSFAMHVNGILVGAQDGMLLVTSMESEHRGPFCGAGLNALMLEGMFGDE